MAAAFAELPERSQKARKALKTGGPTPRLNGLLIAA